MLRRVYFPDKPTPEWFVVDLLKHHEMAGVALSEVRANLVDTLRLGRWDTGLELWFKGGTSLSKGYGVIQRFSEDLDLMVQHGSAADLPAVTNWTSVNRGPIAARKAFYRRA